jgi:importin subunit beta-1
LPFLTNALTAHQEYQLCGVAVGLVADVCRALGPQCAQYCQGFMEMLLAALQSQVLHRSVKPAILSCFGDIALAAGGDFQPFVDTSMSVLQQAGTMQADPVGFLPSRSNMPSFPAQSDLDMVEYIIQLRESILEAITGIVSGIKTSNKGS